MTPYLIFVIVLTIAYIIYYGYNISKDIYGKKGEATNTEEVFDMQSLTEEVTATPVKEMDGGFSLGEHLVDAPTSFVEEVSEAKTDKYSGLADQFEQADIYSDGGMFSDEAYEWMVEHNATDSFRKSTMSEKRAVL